MMRAHAVLIVAYKTQGGGFNFPLVSVPWGNYNICQLVNYFACHFLSWYSSIHNYS